jgi:phospholipid/cholesterol/gamma-HCH transport system substrate-binding protein
MVPVASTSEAPSIEDTFTALSLVLNGGGLDKLQTIAGELDTALNGRTGDARDALIQLRKVVADLDAHKDAIGSALDGVQRVSAALDKDKALIVQALGEFPATLQLLAQDTGQLRTLLTKIATLGDTVQNLLARGQDAMLADFDALRPTLDALAASRDNLVPTINSLVRFGKLFDRASPGDYLNLDVTVQLLFDAPAQHPDNSVAAPAKSPSDAFATLMTGGLR